MALVIVGQPKVKKYEAGLWRAESEADIRVSGETARHLALRWVVRLRYGFIAGEIAIIAALQLGLQITMPPWLSDPPSCSRPLAIGSSA